MEEDLLKISTNTENKATINYSKIVVVRHGESLANKEGIYQGQSYDTDLSELGKKQAVAVAERLSEIGIKKVVSSPLRRTYLTALEIAEIAGTDVIIDHRLTETNHGKWEGKNKAWIMENFPDLYNLWLTKPTEVSFPEGETFLDTVERIKEFIESPILDEDVMVVTHDNIIRIMLSLTSKLPLDLIWRFEVESGGLNFFEKNLVGGKQKLRLMLANDVRHLQGIRSDLSQHAL